MTKVRTQNATTNSSQRLNPVALISYDNPSQLQLVSKVRWTRFFPSGYLYQVRSASQTQPDFLFQRQGWLSPQGRPQTLWKVSARLRADYIIASTG